ncbi:hypothetical protein CC85DRAFT_201541 [Cutaneotrichosporon oleaginosum]|uniref:BUB protein kinase n=1 Tax=Cutaneotrichosporon oleaginosum TaxID=879819 RepID=A0A0J0XUD3_9TREE|nr:uncharacterized protein CC85DRAFT_201541 [Cutaneotrichosporon oleaginosum]KLT44675.1 hypothetical protein CC85DRAFT_201541 [Cutaneotrichosporon oleaginosum]TXT07662.1 hypothetical protein COLE_04586 [Cutaneotrichosporon oleaginosum]
MAAVPATPRATSPDAPTTDFALLEAQKENIRPLATGRSAAALGAYFEADEEARKAQEAKVQQFQRDIEEAERRDREGEDMADGVADVLDLWNRYVSFTVQNNPSSPSRIIPVVESATRRFIDDARYQQDIRYLKLWIIYARQVERREEVWMFLESRDVGTRHAAFYEEWALVLEGIGRKKKADEVYRLGIARRAAPLERLKNRHAAFLTRIMAPSSEDIPEDDPTPPTQPRRAALGAIGGPPPSVQQTPAGRSRATNGSKMEIFADTAGRSDPEHTPWEDFGTHEGRRKENTIEAAPWRGETLPQSAARHRVAPRTPKIEVFKDSETNGTAVTGGGEVMRAKAPPSEAEMLRLDPLRNFDVGAISTLPTVPETRPTALVAPAAPTSARKPSKDKKREKRHKFVMEPWTCPTGGAEIVDAKGKRERRMFDWDAVFRGGEEWSFEEVRARQRGLLGKEYKPVTAWERAWHAGGATGPKAPPQAPRPPSPTVNTKLANAEVMDLFNQTIHGGKARQSDSESSDEDEDDGDDHEEQVMPTPLPRPRAAMMTPGGMVPPTPCPAPGRSNIFADENSEPFGDENAPAARKLVVFDENANADENRRPAMTPRAPLGTTPRAPLGMRTPLAPTPRAVADENDTPAPSRPVQRNIFALQQDAIAEEEESSPRTRSPRESLHQSPIEHVEVQDENKSYRTEANAEGYSYRTEVGPEDETEAQNDHSYRTEPEPEGEGYQETFNDHYEAYPEERPFRNQMYNRHLLTPVTERTFENTVTTAKSSRHGFAITEEEEEEEDESRSPSRADRSGLFDTGAFDVPEGYTIARKLNESKDATQSSVDASGDFVTAQYKSPATERVEALRQKASPVAKMEIFQDEPKVSQRIPVYQDENRPSAKLMVFSDEPKTSLKLQEPPIAEPSPAKCVASPAAPVAALGALALAPVLSDVPNPCNPSDAAVIATLLERIDPPLEDQPLIRRIPDKSGRLAALQKHAKMHARRSSSASMRQSLSPDEFYHLQLGGKTYEATHKIGEGGFGSVFLAVDQELQMQLDDADDDDEDAAKVAIKVEKPTNLWEAVVLSRVHERIAANLVASIIRPRGLFAYADESFLLLDYCRQGTLLDVVNKAAQWSIGPSLNGPAVPDEILAIFFTIELLRLVEGLHTAGFIHGDLKIDNCLVRLDPATNWDAQYARDGTGGWSAKGIRLIDFGRASDLSLFSAGDKQTFVADWKADARDCIQLREGRPWSFESDYFGLASVCYCLLHGKYIGTVIEDGRVKLDAPMKRYWQTDLWTKLFDTLLNPADVPITEQLTSIRAEFEDWLEDNCVKNGRNLRQLLKRIESRAMEGR